MLESLAPARRRFVLVVIGVLAAGVLTAVIAAVLNSRPTEGAAQDEPGPVVLVSGYGGNTAALDPLAAALRDAGRQVEVAPVSQDGVGDLDAQAADLGRFVDGVLEDTGAASADIVGYSAGGVVARLWVRDYGGDEVARRVLTVGSPHHGTEAARFGAAAGCPPACQQLVPDSDLLRALNAGDETPAGPRFVSVWSEADQLVVPPETSRLDGALNLTVQSVCPGARTEHGELPGDPVVLALLDSALGEDSPAVPTAIPC